VKQAAPSLRVAVENNVQAQLDRVIVKTEADVSNLGKQKQAETISSQETLQGMTCLLHVGMFCLFRLVQSFTSNNTYNSFVDQVVFVSHAMFTCI